MILAAGRGERMRPLTDATPKALLCAGGKTLIERHLENLKRAGIHDAVINHAHLGERIEAALGDGGRYGICIHYSPEAEALETAGGIANALPLLADGPFLVVNADVYCGLEFSGLLRKAGAMLEKPSVPWRLVLVDNPPDSPCPAARSPWRCRHLPLAESDFIGPSCLRFARGARPGSGSCCEAAAWGGR